MPRLRSGEHAHNALRLGRQRRRFLAQGRKLGGRLIVDKPEAIRPLL
jgi:hypothetical protein